MSSSTIDSVLYIGQKALRAITNNYKNELRIVKNAIIL